MRRATVRVLRGDGVTIRSTRAEALVYAAPDEANAFGWSAGIRFSSRVAYG